MASYARLLGQKVIVRYRAGDILLTASGALSADSGRSIFLEEHLEQRGKRSYFRWEIPYQCIHRIEEAPQEPQPAESEPPAKAPVGMASSASAGADSSSAGILSSLPQPPKST